MSKQKRRAVSILLLALMISAFFAMPLSAFAEEDLSKVNEAQYGVVRVICDVPGKGISIGTGFAVGKEGEPAQYFVTNVHVIEANPDDVSVSFIDYYDTVPAEVIERDDYRDLAILRVRDPIEERHPLALVSPDELQKGQSIFCLGFPGLSDYSDQGDKLASGVDDITVTRGTVSNTNHKMDGVEYVYSDVKVNEGNSGGPMVNEYGHVVGVNTLVVGSGSELNNMTLAVSIDYVMEMLDDLDIPYTVGKADGKTGSSDGFTLDTTTLIIIIAAVLVVAAVVVTVILVVNNKKKKAASTEGSDAPTAIRKMTVRCVQGPIAGREISSAAPVRVGRDMVNCQLVFPDGTPGVSKTHCEFSLTGMGIAVRDLNSSYGTYVNGRRLAPGELFSLGTGAVVVLGSERVVVTVELSY